MPGDMAELVTEVARRLSKPPQHSQALSVRQAEGITPSLTAFCNDSSGRKVFMMTVTSINRGETAA
ncbi:hypothetical protein KCP70_22870 [Salmonella enterica subsp. enterica]|nr:hypothetical protein KCP70_22870 [Salmonella enterica subsp. enterica]